ncbi:DUF2254 domain-containing protein [Auraticoccus sp. F435]|uniref:DUF2254 domain-containing protein n=1 Tax=Auraticoccus cholistanensis TaxID=2656650 RepID=A0A6A9UZI2_9ACTN|nr:DUF2254 domain-containing protein [Auraticoccus cholistanensis]MVA77412.1 DUF2254 domain-containing protein [Auraticoccus cholistanensis]
MDDRTPARPAHRSRPAQRAGSSTTLRARLWFWPSVAAASSFLATLGLLLVRPSPEATWVRWAWPSGTDAASGLLQAVASSIMTATTLIFSLTVVALQLASQQFSPRLLREFARDRVTQAVLAVLVSTFVVAVTGLRGMDPDGPLPVLVPPVVLLLAIASAGALLVFVGHIVRSLRVDTMMVSVHQQAAAALRETYPRYGDRSKDPSPELAARTGGELVTSTRSGLVKTVHPRLLVRSAHDHGLFVAVMVRPGDHVGVGSPIAEVWSDQGVGPPRHEGLDRVLATAVELGYERTLEQDAALGLRQLTDIAVKAISPSINDPITAAHAVGYCTDLLVRLQGCRLGPQQHDDEDGVPRVMTLDRDHRYYLDLVCAPVRRFGSAEPLVLTALLRMLRDCAANARDDEQREELSRQTGLVLESTDPQLLGYDAAAVHDLARRVGLALDGDLRGAYQDRAGETRSV